MAKPLCNEPSKRKPKGRHPNHNLRFGGPQTLCKGIGKRRFDLKTALIEDQGCDSVARIGQGPDRKKQDTSIRQFRRIAGTIWWCQSIRGGTQFLPEFMRVDDAVSCSKLFHIW